MLNTECTALKKITNYRITGDNSLLKGKLDYKNIVNY